MDAERRERLLDGALASLPEEELLEEPFFGGVRERLEANGVPVKEITVGELTDAIERKLAERR